MTAAELRRDLSTRNLEWAQGLRHETTFGQTPAVIHAAQQDGSHGNFHPASWRRIQAQPNWSRRLAKSYTAGKHLARRHDRWRGELECATSSDALLMNVFCYPGLLRRPQLLQLLGVEVGASPNFGIQGKVPLGGGLTDRTEIDMAIGDLLVEAKLTEKDFQTARPALVLRYRDLDEVFVADTLPRTDKGDFDSYQLLRGVLAAHALGCRFAVLLGTRRVDLVERWFAILRSVRDCRLRSRLQLLTWQEIAEVAPPSLRQFLATKYGILAPVSARTPAFEPERGW